MKKEKLKISDCNKKCFTPHQAEAALEKAAKSKSERRNEIRMYRCNICDCFHLSSKEKRGDITEIILVHKKDFKKFL